MTRSWFALALLAAACGKSKDTGALQGSATGSESPGSAAPVVAVALPTVAGHGYEPSTSPARVLMAASAIVVDGKPVAGIPGVVDGLSAPSSAPRFVLALDKTIEVERLFQLIAALKTQGLTSYGLLAQKVGGETVMLPFDLRASAPAESPRRAPGSDLQRQLDEVKKAGAEVKVGPSPGGRAAPSSGSGAGSDGPPSTVVVEVREVSLSPESSLSTDIAKAKISATYLTGLRRCVKSFAEKDATTTSSFTLTLTINESGTGVDAKAMGVTNDAAECIAKQAATWRFPIPKDADRNGVKVAATVAFDITVDETTVRENAANAQMMPGESVPAPDPGDALGLVVTITKDELLVWSISGLEGTRKEPRARIPRADARKLSALLEDIVKRRWSGTTTRAAYDLDVIVMPEPTTTMQLLAEILGAVRATPSGTSLFPSVRFAADVE